jgi:dTDP-4-amino-4,6-dideoxygalactose transaminase
VTASARSTLFDRAARAARSRIRCLVPDLPTADELRPWLERIDANRWYTNFGPLAAEYEDRLTAMHGATCVTLSSGSAALELGIAALDLPRGTRVLLPSFTFPATVLAVLRCGLTPVFTDVCGDTWTLTPDLARAALARGDCALAVPVCAFGCPLDAQAWDAFAADSGCEVLIDAAAALGVQRVGERTHAAFSLHATKPLGIGEGGVFATCNGDLAERVRRLTNHGLVNGQVAYPAGTNAKLGEYPAAVGLAQLERASGIRAKRLAVWRLYRCAMASIAAVRMQQGLADTPPAMLIVMLPVAAAAAAEALAASSIEPRRWYHPPLHRHPLFAAVERVGELAVTNELAEHAIGLPFHTRLAEGDVIEIVETLRRSL